MVQIWDLRMAAEPGPKTSAAVRERYGVCAGISQGMEVSHGGSIYIYLHTCATYISFDHIVSCLTMDLAGGNARPRMRLSTQLFDEMPPTNLCVA